jgi:hypothetical protein
LATTPRTPRGLTAVPVRPNALAVRWQRSRGAAGYHVQAVDPATGKPAWQVQLPPSATNTTIGGLSPGGAYQVRVHALPGNGAHASVNASLPRSP